MSAATRIAGYPCHRVVEFRRSTNEHGVRFTHWTAACGVERTDSGHQPFGLAGQARRRELCAVCFPGNAWHAPPGVHFPDPIEIT